MNTQFTVYSKPACGYCEQAKALLASKGVPFKVIQVDVGQPKVDDETYISREDLQVIFPAARTLPQIHALTGAGEVYIGGFKGLQAYFDD